MELSTYCEDLGRRARTASRILATVLGQQKNLWLGRAAGALETRTPEVLKANASDLVAAASSGLTPAQLDRLRLTPERIRAAAAGLREVAALPDPVGRVHDSSVRPNGLHVQ